MNKLLVISIFLQFANCTNSSLKNIQVLYAKKQYREVLSQLDQYKVDPDLANEYKGHCYYYLEEYENAISYYLKVVSTGKAGFIIYTNLGDTYFKQEELEKAYNCFAAAYTIDPNGENINYNLGIYYLRKNICNKAIEHLERELPKQPMNGELFSALAQSYSSCDSLQKSLYWFSKAIETDSSNYLFYFLKGLTELEANLVDASIKDFTSAIKFNTNFADAYYYRSQAFLLTLKKEESMADSAKAVSLGWKYE